jgi:hypothetical protein
VNRNGKRGRGRWRGSLGLGPRASGCSAFRSAQRRRHESRGVGEAAAAPNPGAWACWLLAVPPSPFVRGMGTGRARRARRARGCGCCTATAAGGRLQVGGSEAAEAEWPEGQERPSHLERATHEQQTSGRRSLIYQIKHEPESWTTADGRGSQFLSVHIASIGFSARRGAYIGWFCGSSPLAAR